jgi:hypothetical protein
MTIERFRRIKCGLIFEGKVVLKCLFGGIWKGSFERKWMIVLSFEAKQSMVISETITAYM